MPRTRLLAPQFQIVCWLLAETTAVRASVTEPNGQVVPILKPTDPANYSETTIQDYLNAVGETAIDAVKSASSEPGKFSPLCSFDASLVVSQSNAAAGISWYNVDEANPTRVPRADELFELIKPTTTTNVTFSADKIRNDAAYTGGYIGFALTRYDNGADKPQVPVYFSEYRRNTLCSGCEPKGQWIASLTFHSVLRQDTYYIAFEDWPTYGGTNPSDWHNDGDFNDKVFKIVGISCAGGGLACATGKIGLCGNGVTECANDGQQPACTQIYEPRNEICDAIDNDCNGAVDDGNLCLIDQVCLRGSCVYACGGLEYKCPNGMACGNDGYCVEARCRDVICEQGLACRDGVCKSRCSDVVCPVGQTCVDGACKDLCLGKVCGPGSICTDGACVGTCGCVPCKEGKVCDSTSGACVDPGCAGRACPTGNVCIGGACVDACAGSKCPGAASCTNGICAAPPPRTDAVPTGSGGMVFVVGSSVGGQPVSSQRDSTRATAGGSKDMVDFSSAGASGCDCSTRGSKGGKGAVMLLLLGILRRARRRAK